MSHPLLHLGLLPLQFLLVLLYLLEVLILLLYPQVVARSDEDCDWKAECARLKSLVEKERQQRVALQSNLNACNAELEKSSRKIASLSFDIDRFKSHPDSVRYYTGFPTIEHFDSCFIYLKSSAASMRYYKPGVTESEHASNKPGPATKLSLREQVFLGCVRLRLGLQVEDLADRMDVSPSTVSRTFTT